MKKIQIKYTSELIAKFAAVNELRQTGKSIDVACREVGVQPHNYKYWRYDREKQKLNCQRAKTTPIQVELAPEQASSINWRWVSTLQAEILREVLR